MNRYAPLERFSKMNIERAASLFPEKANGFWETRLATLVCVEFIENDVLMYTVDCAFYGLKVARALYQVVEYLNKATSFFS